MVRKKMTEVAAKRLFHRLSDGRFAATAEERATATPAVQRVSAAAIAAMPASSAASSAWLDVAVRDVPAWLAASGARLVVKADVGVGQRARHGLVLVDTDVAGAGRFMRDVSAAPLTVDGVRGRVDVFLVEPFVAHDAEYYLSVRTERLVTMVTVAAAGGVDVDLERRGRSTALAVECTRPAAAELLASGVFDDVEDAATAAALAELAAAAVAAMTACDGTLWEANPVAVIGGGGGGGRGGEGGDGAEEPRLRAVPLDLRLEVDSTARWQHAHDAPEWAPDAFPRPFGSPPQLPQERRVEAMDERSGASFKLLVLRRDARLWLLVAGGGASVIFADAVADAGLATELGNYGEYSGAPSEVETYSYAKAVIELVLRSAGVTGGEHRGGGGGGGGERGGDRGGASDDGASVSSIESAFYMDAMSDGSGGGGGTSRRAPMSLPTSPVATPPLGTPPLTVLTPASPPPAPPMLTPTGSTASGGGGGGAATAPPTTPMPAAPRALVIGGGIANFTDVATTFRGINRALREHAEALRRANVKIFVRRGGPNYASGLAEIRELGARLGIPMVVCGPETAMTAVVRDAAAWLRGDGTVIE